MKYEKNSQFVSPEIKQSLHTSQEHLPAHSYRTRSEMEPVMISHPAEVFFTIDAQLKRFVQMTSNCFALFGYTPGELVNEKRNIDLIIEPDDQYCLDHHLRLSSEGKRTSCALRLKHKNGTVSWAEFRFIPLSTDRARSKLITGIIRDINQTGYHTKGLNQNEAKLNTILNNTLDSIFSVDTSYKLSAFNTMYAQTVDRMFNVRVKEGDYFFISSAGDDTNLFWKSHLDKTFNGETFSIEYEYSVQGEKLYCEVSFSPIIESGAITGAGCLVRDITGRKKAEDALKENKRFLETLIKNLPGYSYRVKTDQKYTPEYISHGIEPITGYSVAEFMSGKIVFSELVFSEDMGGFDQLIRNALVCDDAFECTYRISTRTRETRWLCESGRGIRDENGKLVALEGFVSDITESKTNQENLKRSEEQRRLIMDAAMDAIICFDPGGKISYWNPTAERIFGWKESEATELIFPAIIIPREENQKTVSMTEKLIFAGTETNINTVLEMSAVRKNGQRFPAELALTRIRQNDQDFFCAYIRDITERKNAELKLIKTNERFEYVSKATKDAIYDWDIHKDRIYFNESFHAIYNHLQPEDHFSLEQWVKRIHPEDAGMVQSSLGNALNATQGQQWSCEYRFRKKDNTYTYILENAYIIRDLAGKATRMIGTMKDISELKAAETELRAVNERYELVTRATNDAIWDWNMVKNELYWSEAYEKIFGHVSGTRSENIADWTKRIHPDDLEMVTESLTDALLERSNNYWECEYRYLRADGTVAYVNDRGFILYDEKRKPLRMVGAMQDITRRKEAEEHLQRSETNLRHIFENTDTAYLLLDRDGRILSFNHLATEIIQDETLQIEEGRLYVEVLPENRKDTVAGMINHVLSKGKTISYETIYGNEAHPKWIYVRMQPIFSDEKQIIGLSIAARNITERKLAQQRIQKSEANLNTIFNNTEVGYVLLSQDLKVVSFNQRALRDYKEELDCNLQEGQALSELLNQDRLPAELLNYHGVLSGEKHHFEISLPHHDGSTWYRVSVLPVVGGEEELLGLIVATEDITSRKNSDLDKEKMTLDLTQRNRDLEQFAYIISHNLRSPVANIIGLSQLLTGSSLNCEDFNTCLQGLTTSVRKLDEIIMDLNHILQVRREVNEKKEWLEFRTIVNDVAGSIQNLIDKEEVQIIQDFTGAEKIFTIKSYLTSIFYNLISNSIRYRKPSEKPLIFIETFVRDEKLCIRYRDNGLGFNMAVQGPRIFGLYKKFHTHTEGKGMGLYMTKTQVEILNGKISLESKENEGSEFLIVFG